MNILEAHARYATRHESGGEYESGFGELGYEPIDDTLTPLLMCAAVSLSGMLDDCEDDHDLDQAGKHFLSLVDGGVVTVAQWQEEMFRIFDELARWAESASLN